MQLKILTLLFCCAVFGAIAVHGAHTQLRFMNAQLASQTNIGITTNRYQNGSLIVRSRVNPVFLDIPASPYITLPSASIPLNTTVQFFAYNADSAQIPVTSKAGINATLDAGSSYTLVYADQSEYMWSSIAKFPAPKLLLFKERSASSGTFVKFVNVAVFTADQYSATSLLVYFAGTRYNLTFGGQSAEIAVTPGLNYEVTAKLNSGNQTVQFTPVENSTTVIYFRGDYYYPMGFGYNIVTINGEGFVAEPDLPVATPISPSPLSTKIRLINGLSLETNLTMTIYDNGTPRFSYASVFGPYQTLTSGSGSYYVSIGDMSGEMFNTRVALTAGKTYSYVIGSRTEGVLLEDTPARDNNTAYMRVINCVQSINVTFVAYRTPTPYYQNSELFFGQTTSFFPGTAGANVQVSMNSLGWEEQSNYTLDYDTVTTVVALGDTTYFQLFANSQSLSSIDTPVNPYPTPVAAVPYSSSAPTAPSAPVAARFRLINGLSSINVTVTVWDNGFPRQSAGLYSGYYEYIYTSGSLYVEVSNDGVLMQTNYINVTLGKSYWYVVCAYSKGIFLEEAPTSYSPARSYVRVLNCMQISGPTTVEITLPDNYLVYDLSNSEYTDFVETQQGYYLVELNHEGYSLSNRTNFLANSSIMTFWLVDESYSGNVREESSGFQDASLFTHPDCYGYQDLTTGACVCYSGFYTTSYLRQCATPSPSSCYVNVTSKLDNDVVPFVIWGESQVYGNRLSLNVYSEMVASRYTVIEFPNPQCNLLNSPQYYQKAVNGCLDVINLNVPFIECGFVKTSDQYADVYKGIIHVKQVDRYIQFGDYYQARVIDTPFPVSINMPKTLAVSSDVQVFGPPSVAIDAAFVGQTVNTQTSSANLQYMSSVQYPLVIESIEVVDLPYGVSAWVEIVNVNCSMVGVPCLQRLELHLNTSSCTISGVYRLALSLICRSDVGCPDEAKNGTQVYLESRVVSQNLCSEVSVDIDLNGYIQAYTDSNFANQALAFYPGQSAYFLLNAYSSRVSLSSVTLASVYYYGPNVNFQYLLYENNVTSAAQSNNFTWGSLGTSQAWFSVDVSVGTPNSNDSTLFKLYQGQNAVYNFVAYVDVEWSVQANNATGAPTSFKKRMALQSTGTNQNSQFSAQVQIAGPTPSAQQAPTQQQQPSTVEATPKNGQISGATTTQFSYLALFVTLVATLCLM